MQINVLFEGRDLVSATMDLAQQISTKLADATMEEIADTVRTPSDSAIYTIRYIERIIQVTKPFLSAAERILPRK